MKPIKEALKELAEVGPREEECWREVVVKDPEVASATNKVPSSRRRVSSITNSLTTTLMLGRGS